MHEMQTAVTDVRGVGQSVCHAAQLCMVHLCSLCQITLASCSSSCHITGQNVLSAYIILIGTFSCDCQLSVGEDCTGFII